MSLRDAAEIGPVLRLVGRAAGVTADGALTREVREGLGAVRLGGADGGGRLLSGGLAGGRLLTGLAAGTTGYGDPLGPFFGNLARFGLSRPRDEIVRAVVARMSEEVGRIGMPPDHHAAISLVRRLDRLDGEGLRFVGDLPYLLSATQYLFLLQRMGLLSPSMTLRLQPDFLALARQRAESGTIGTAAYTLRRAYEMAGRSVPGWGELVDRLAGTPRTVVRVFTFPPLHPLRIIRGVGLLGLTGGPRPTAPS